VVLVDFEDDELARKFAENGMILSSGGFDRISHHGLDADEVLSVAKERNLWLVTDEFLQEFVPEKREVKEEVTVERPKKSIFAKEIDSELKIFRESDVTKRSTCEGKIEDFLEYFGNKYQNLRGILRERDVLKGAVPISAIKKQHPDGTISIIAMVTNKRESGRGFRFLDVEDPSGEMNVLVPSGSRLMDDLYNSIMLDEVIGITGKMRKELFIASEIFQPDLPLDNKTNSADEPVCMALLSDLHVGSYLFLEKEFNHFLDCLNLKGNNDERFQNIKYILVAGDLVDGIGVYPKQEKELSIPDIYKQYDFLASLLERIPDYIDVVLSMGNHDAVRGAEPQPRLDKDIGGRLYDLNNVHLVGNPAMVSTHDVKTLLYHGTSLDTIIGSLANCTYSRPEIAMTEYLKRRYLIPSYGDDNISPERDDYLIINEVPDIFHGGHVHTNGYANYRGVKIINSGTFQGRTRYQEEQGHVPTPGRVPIINLQSHEVSVVHF